MKFFLFVISVLYNCCVFSQTTDSIPQKHQDLPVAYKQMHYSSDYIYALDTHNQLFVWQMNGDTLRTLISDQVTALAKDKLGKVFCYKAEKGIAELKGMQTDPFLKDAELGTVHSVFYDKENLPLFATSQGMIYKGILNKPTDALRFYEYRRPGVVKRADFYYMDSEEHLWMMYDHGEFGAYNVVFDLNTLTFYEYRNFSETFDDRKSLRINKERKDKLNREMQKDSAYVFSLKNKKRLRAHYDNPQYAGKRTLLADATLTGNLKGVAENGKGEVVITESLMHFFLDGSIKVGKKISGGNISLPICLIYLRMIMNICFLTC
ncbi:hypothetical protein [Flavobacterium psychrotrophum]|uniref:hypothetical protein n=1 Tax=Flavobacterium psychrotrophum TaxID=2294119 RepID=UPI000E318446|nr:hypothetical protein [Flavobacterium psychrotrophum]